MNMFKVSAWLNAFSAAVGIAIFLLAISISAREPQGNEGPEAGQNGTAAEQFESQWLKMRLRAGWTIGASSDPTLKLQRGDYVLTVDPVYDHASGIIGGRFGEIVARMRGVAAVMGMVADRAPWDCAIGLPDETKINDGLLLATLYTDRTKVGNHCNFPSSLEPVWFGSYGVGLSAYSEYAITLDFETDDVNRLPRKSSPELIEVLGEVTSMLKTLELKPPLTISRIDPRAAPPGSLVTIHGSGFNWPNAGMTVIFDTFPSEPVENRTIAADGTSLSFEVPSSIDAVSCHTNPRAGGEHCAPIVVDGANINTCPDADYSGVTFCGIAIPPGRYSVIVSAARRVRSNPASFTLTVPESRAVSVELVYPNSFVRARRDVITVIGRGFTSTGNVVQIGAATVNDIPSPDGTTIRFQAPVPAGPSMYPGLFIYKLSVSNANGQSNTIKLAYR